MIHPIRSLPTPVRAAGRGCAPFLLALVLFNQAVQAAHGQAKEQVAAHIDANAETYARTAQSIWELAEVGYQEHESSGALQSLLSDAGFTVDADVAGMPTAFVAEWGSGEPVIGIMGEFDALPGINQDRISERQTIEGKDAGHACGHHLFGTGSTAAAIAVKDWLERSGTTGTVRMYGTPAEEGGAGKVYMVRAGLFDDVDAMLHWHPGDRNSAGPATSLANKSAKFRFYGVSAHAAGAPERGRSALDAAEAMNHMVNLMREHVPQETRIHYVITNGGSAPNVIPDFAEVFYYVRNPESENVKELFERVVKAAEGAAMGTETRMEYEVIHGIYSLLPNDVLARAMHANLTDVGGVEYDSRERAFAESIHETLHEDAASLETAAMVRDYALGKTPASTDVGDVSSVVPTAGLSAATWVPGTAAHSWQAVAAGGTSIGNKGMLVAAKTMAMTAVDLFTTPSLIAEAKAEYLDRVGPDFRYVSLLGDRAPPLDYRVNQR